MKRTKLTLSISVTALLALGLVVAVLSIPKAEPELEPPPPTPYSVDTEALSRLVDYYDGQLDPEVPRIKVTARQFGDGCAVDYTLPYDGILRESDEKTQSDQEQTWFLNLMNNFWSLPKLHDGLQNLSVPSQITITFSEPPVGEIAITDYVIVDDSGIATKGTPTLSHSYDRTQIFSPAGNTLSFDLWVYDGVDLMSVQPPLRGMLVRCTIDEKEVEYYILFQTSYFLGMFPFDSDFSHLTPLEP